MSSKFASFPSWAYGPNGESAVFDHEAHVPDGWEPTPFDGVDYTGTKQPAAEAEAVAALNAKLSEAAAASAAKDEQIRKLDADLIVAGKREAGLTSELAVANERAAKAEADAAAQVEAAVAAQAVEIEAFRAELSKAREEVESLKAQIAKFDGDKDGKPGGSAPKAPKQ